MSYQKLQPQLAGLMLAVLILVGCGIPATAPVPEPSAVTSLPLTATSILPSVTPVPPSDTPTLGLKVNATTSGTITMDEIWRGEIHLTGDIEMAHGVMLTIEPGTVVYIASNSDDQHCCAGGFDDEYTRSNNDPTRFGTWFMSTILIDGRGGVIRAIGTPEEPIIFKPEGESTSPAQWDGIYVERGTIQYATLLYGGHTVIQPLGTSGENIEIAHNEVRYFLWAGIDSHADNVWIHHNIVEGGGHQAIGVRGNTLAEHNIVIGAQTGIGVERGREAVIRNNIVIDCAHGMELRSGSNITVVNNTLAWISGPPNGWYYQGDLVYPVFQIGGGIENHLDSPQITLVNNIIYGPFDWGIGLHQRLGEGSVVNYNLMWGQSSRYGGGAQSAAGANNYSQNPLLADPINNDFRLLEGSPAIDAGDPSIIDADGSRSDLGAYGGTEGQGW